MGAMGPKGEEEWLGGVDGKVDLLAVGLGSGLGLGLGLVKMMNEVEEVRLGLEL